MGKVQERDSLRDSVGKEASKMDRIYIRITLEEVTDVELISLKKALGELLEGLKVTSFEISIVSPPVSPPTE